MINFIKSIIKKTYLFTIYKRRFPYGNAFHEIFGLIKLYRKCVKEIKKIQILEKTSDLDKQIIVSLTTYPRRIKQAGIAIASIFKQNQKPDKIILTLSKLQFPNKKLPKLIKEEIKNGLEIIWTDDDLRSHKKYFYVMQKYPEDIIITIDDDNYYEANTVERLVESYGKYPNLISCIYAHDIELYKDSIKPYKDWNKAPKSINIPSRKILAVGVGGVLYPPHSLNSEIFNSNFIIVNNITADDLFLKVMEILNEPITSVICIGGMIFHPIPDSQRGALMFENIGKNKNDVDLTIILDKYNNLLGKNDTFIHRMKSEA